MSPRQPSPARTTANLKMDSCSNAVSYGARVLADLRKLVLRAQDGVLSCRSRRKHRNETGTIIKGPRHCKRFSKM